MKPGNESLLFSWSARLVAMEPKAKMGLWLFREVGGGFSELSSALQPGSGPILKWISCVFSTGGNGAAQFQVGSQRAGHPLVHQPFSCLLPESCAQGQPEQEELRQDVFPKPLRGGELPARREIDIVWEGLEPYPATSHTVTHISTDRQSSRTERTAQSNWGIWFRVQCTAQPRLLRWIPLEGVTQLCWHLALA